MGLFSGVVVMNISCIRKSKIMFYNNVFDFKYSGVKHQRESNWFYFYVNGESIVLNL